MNVTTTLKNPLRMNWMSSDIFRPIRQPDFILGRWTNREVSGSVTASVPGPTPCGHVLPRSLRSKASVMAPWTKEDAPADLLGSWWVYSPGSSPAQVFGYETATGNVFLQTKTSVDSTDITWLLTAYTRVPAP